MQLMALLLAVAASAPDTAYFQQHVSYRIEARLDEQTATLHGRLQLDYRNNAPAALDTLWFHLHLNAFRPHSLWAKRDLQFRQRRFQDLTADQHAFERVQRVRVDGVEVKPIYPGAPDSTVMGVPLARPLTAGAAARIEMEWSARPATEPRRQARRGRHYDFAHWYPRIAVYDRGGWQVQPLLPQTEFYGEFGSYDVTIDVAADQVIGATGVPVAGDPGWESAAAATGTSPRYRRDAYPHRDEERLGLLAERVADGRKRVRWRADDVHHFAWTTSPDYIYEGGNHGDVAVHVLYQPGDTAWAKGVAVQRTIDALAWYHDIFGAFAWPQITNVHRIDTGGTEFPMIVMNGSASQGLILHEVGHNYVYGILANNEWREAWLDEGLVSFLTNWALERAHVPVTWDRDIAAVIEQEVVYGAYPIALAAAAFPDMPTFGAFSYTKTSLVFRMLRWLIGEQNMRVALRKFYDTKKLQHVTEADLRAAFNAVHTDSLDWFFQQWLHTTAALDYRLGTTSLARNTDGTWSARVEVIRDGDAWMPVDLRVGGVTQRLDTRERRQVVTVQTHLRPVDVVIDPDRILIDRDFGNNRRAFPR